MSADKTSIFLRDCRVHLSVGIYDHEKVAPQLVVINVEAETNLQERFNDLSESNVARVVSYETIYNFIHVELSNMGHIYLLEAAAESIIAFCFKDTRIRSVTVRIEKPNVLVGAVPGISLTRTNNLKG